MRQTPSLGRYFDEIRAFGEIQARVTYDPARDLLVGTVLATGVTLEAMDARELAELLFAAGVRHGHVSMPDWREGDTAPATGDKIALNGHLNRLGQVESARDPS